MKFSELILKEEPILMGIINFTPDSFSDGGDFFDVNAAVDRVDTLLKHGCNIIDLGCESTRPNAKEVSEDEELKRLKKVLHIIREKFPDILISIDTYKSNVAEYAIQNGVDIINDIYGAKGNKMAQVANKYNVPIIVMHNEKLIEGKEIESLIGSLNESINICLDTGVKKENIIIDPGIGFRKNAEENILITKNMDKLCDLGYPVLYGVSRKRVTDYILGGGSEPKSRDVVSAVLSMEAIKRGAKIVRLHNLQIISDMIKVENIMKY